MTSNKENTKEKVLLADLYKDYKSSEISKGLSEEQIRDRVENMYKDINSEFSTVEKGDKKFIRFSVNSVINKMMGNISSSIIPRKYDAKVVNRIMEVPYSYKDDLLRMSLYFYNVMQEFKGIIEYKSNMLTYSNVLSPSNLVDTNNFDIDDYIKNVKFIENYNLKSKLGQVTKILVREDVYYGYEMSDTSGRNFIWKRLPSEYCEIIGKDKFETYRISFDMSYFDKYPKDLNTFPPEFKEKYYSYKNRNKNKKERIKLNLASNKNFHSYIELDNSKAFAFKFDESVNYTLPYFSGMFVDLIRLADLKDVEVINSISENYKLIHQRVPLNKDSGREDDFLISGEFLQTFHNNLVDTVPKGIGVATTPMDIEGITLKNGINSAEESIVSKQLSNILNQSGTSALLFNGKSTSSLGLNKNIQVDENTLFKLLRQYELFMRKRLYLFNKNTYKYNLKFLDHTYYNTKDLFENYLKAGQFGFNTEFEVNAVLGRSQLDFINAGKVLDVLGLKDEMLPLKSSHVGDGTGTNEQKNENTITDDAINKRES